MSKLEARLGKLEAAASVESALIQIARFIVTPGNLRPIGYRCDGVEIMRCHDESIEMFEQRCFDAVTWPDGHCRLMFFPIVS